MPNPTPAARAGDERTGVQPTAAFRAWWAAPGWRLVLWGVPTAVLGAPSAHLLIPILFLALLRVRVALEWRVPRSLWCGTTVVVVVMICPSGVSLWALTPTRDVPAHLFAFLALALLAGRGPLG